MNARSATTRVILLSVASCFALPPCSTQAADTVQDFTVSAFANVPPLRYRLSGNGSAPGPSVDAGGWDGNFLRLTEEVNGQGNYVAFNQMGSAPNGPLRIDFDFRISPGNGGGADGLAVAYLNSGYYGTENFSPTFDWSIQEEPNLTGSFGVAFDTFNNQESGDGAENSVSLHFDGTRIASVPFASAALPSSALEDNQVRHASILVEPSRAGSRVTMSVSDVQGATFFPFDNQFVPGLAPYDGRLALAARTGGANANHDVDNIRLSHTIIGAGERVVLLEDFEAPLDTPTIPHPALVGGTPFAVSQLDSYPGPAVVPGISNRLFGGSLRLATQAGTQNNTIAFDQTAGRSRQIDAEFDFRISGPGCCSGKADGLSFLLIPTDIYDNTGPLPIPVGEEPNLAGAFGVGFDTFDNDEEDCPNDCSDRRANHVSLHWDGAQVGQIAVIDPATLDLANGQFNRVNLRIEQGNDGSNVTVSITDGVNGNAHTPIANRFIPGMDLGDVRAAFAARTGAAADHHDIDNVRVVFDEDTSPRLGAGDAEQDLDFDQIDLLVVQVGGKYLSALGATWGEGDWNGAPGGRPGSPPPGDGTFNQQDLQTALGAGIYRTGPYATGRPSVPTGDDLGSVVYHAASGEVRIDAPSGLPLTSVNIESSAGVLSGTRADNLGGSFDFHDDHNLFKATFGGEFGSLSFGNVAAAGLDTQTVLNDISVIATFADRVGLAELDVVYVAVPEPSAWVLLGLGGIALAFTFRTSTGSLWRCATLTGSMVTHHLQRAVIRKSLHKNSAHIR